MNAVTTTHTPAARAAAFTLIEMVVSLSVISIVFLAMGSVMVLASKAVPDPKASTNLALDAADLLEQMAGEIQVATSVSIATDKGISFTVPDRDDDGDDESIVYLWGGVAGSALVRQYNGGTVVTVLPNVYEFSLKYKTISVSQPDVLVESSEVLLDSFSYSLLYGEFPVTQYNWAGQLIRPGGLPASTESWGVSRVLVRAKRHSGSTGITTVQLRPVSSGGRPSTTVLESYDLLESALDSNFRWETVSFSNVNGISPDKNLCLVLKWKAGAEAAGFQHSTISGSGFLITYSQDGGWSYSSSQSLYFYAYGTYKYPQAQPPIDVIQSVTLTLNPGATASSRIRSTVTTLNLPGFP